MLSAKELWQEEQTLRPEGHRVKAGSALYCVMICKLPNLSEPQFHHEGVSTIVPNHPRLM